MRRALARARVSLVPLEHEVAVLIWRAAEAAGSDPDKAADFLQKAAPPQRQSSEARAEWSAADPSIALGLQYFATLAAYNKAHDELDNIDLPTRPTEQRTASTPERLAIAVVQIAYERRNRKIALDRLAERASAMLTLWLQEPATTVCGIALKLRAWLDDTCPNVEKPDRSERMAIAALQDAERLVACGTWCVSSTVRSHLLSAPGRISARTSPGMRNCPAP